MPVGWAARFRLKSPIFSLFCPLFFVIQNVPLGVSLWEGGRGSAQHHTKPSMLLLNAQARLDSFQPSCQKTVCLPKKTKLRENDKQGGNLFIRTFGLIHGVLISARSPECQTLKLSCTLQLFPISAQIANANK